MSGESVKLLFQLLRSLWLQQGTGGCGASTLFTYITVSKEAGAEGLERIFAQQSKAAVYPPWYKLDLVILRNLNTDCNIENIDDKHNHGIVYFQKIIEL